MTDSASDIRADGLVMDDAPAPSSRARPKRRPKPADSVVERTRSVFEKAFPNHVDPESYAASLIERMKETPDEGRGRTFDSFVRQLFYLERTALLCSKPEVAEEIRQAKRIFASKVLYAVYEKLGDPEYRKEKLPAWSEWLFAM